MELTLTHISSDVANDAQPKIVSVCEPEPTTTPQSLDETVGSSDSALAAESASPEIVAETESTGEDEDSIEACMAKLLSRTRGTEVSENEVKSLTAKAALVAARSQQSDSSNSESSMPATPFDPADRSHLTAEPKHKQDRLAAREDLQSFRQVAHQSARSALARHTTKHLLSAFVAKAMLLGVSVMATTAFLGAPLVGMPTQIWKALACAIAMMLSATEVYRSWRQLRCWKAGGAVSRKEAALPTSAATLSVEIATMTESEPPVATNE